MASETTIFNLLYTRGVDMRYSIVHRTVDADVSEPAVMANNISLRQGPSGRPCRIKAPCSLTPGPQLNGAYTCQMTYQQVFLIRSSRLVPLRHGLLSRSAIFVSAFECLLSTRWGLCSPYDNAEAVFVGRLRTKRLKEPLGQGDSPQPGRLHRDRAICGESE